MYEYVFFHKALAEQFLAEARKNDPAARLLRGGSGLGSACQ